MMETKVFEDGYAVVPMVFALAFGSWYRQLKKK